MPIDKGDNTLQAKWKFVSDNLKTIKEVYV